MKKLLLVVIFAATCLATDDVTKVSTIDELEGLVGKEAWAELMMRLPDVPSTQRDARWEKLLERGSVSYLNLIASEGITGVETVAAEMTKTYPQLRKSKDFMKQRNDIGLVAYEACLTAPTDDRDCVKQLVDYVAGDKENLEYVKKAAALVAAKQSPVEALGIYSVAMTPASRAALCGSKEVRATLVAALGASTELVEKDCWTWVKNDVAKEVDRQPAACTVLKRKKAVPSGKCGK